MFMLDRPCPWAEIARKCVQIAVYDMGSIDSSGTLIIGVVIWIELGRSND
jgi:hypothetical protein